MAYVEAEPLKVWQEVNKGLMPQYGTSMHYPYCNQTGCTGCLPAIRVIPEPELDLSIFRTEREGNWKDA